MMAENIGKRKFRKIQEINKSSEFYVSSGVQLPLILIEETL